MNKKYIAVILIIFLTGSILTHTMGWVLNNITGNTLLINIIQNIISVLIGIIIGVIVVKNQRSK